MFDFATQVIKMTNNLCATAGSGQTNVNACAAACSKDVKCVGFAYNVCRTWGAT